MIYLNIDGEDDKQKTANIFHLSNFPPEWRTRNLQNFFKDAQPVFIKWINEKSALLIVKDYGKINVIEDMMTRKTAGNNGKAVENNDDGSLIVIQSYDEYCGINSGIGLKRRKEEEDEGTTYEDGIRSGETLNNGKRRKNGECVIS